MYWKWFEIEYLYSEWCTVRFRPNNLDLTTRYCRMYEAIIRLITKMDLVQYLYWWIGWSISLFICFYLFIYLLDICRWRIGLQWMGSHSVNRQAWVFWCLQMFLSQSVIPIPTISIREWVSEWMNEWMNEWVNEWMNTIMK